MKKLLSIVVLVTFSTLVFSALPAMAEWKSMQAAAGNVVNHATADPTAKGGDPATNRIGLENAVAIGSFIDYVKVYYDVTLIGGNQKDCARALGMLEEELEKPSEMANYVVKEAPVVDGKVCRTVGGLVFSLTLISESGESKTTHERSDSEQQGDSGRNRNWSTSTASSSSVSTEQLFVSSEVSAKLSQIDPDGELTKLAAVADVFAADCKITATAEREQQSKNWSSSGRNTAASTGIQHSKSSTFKTSKEYSKSQSSRVTMREAIETAVAVTMPQGIDKYNRLMRRRSVVPASVTVIVRNAPPGN